MNTPLFIRCPPQGLAHESVNRFGAAAELMIGEVLEGRPEAVTPREDDHGAAILG